MFSGKKHRQLHDSEDSDLEASVRAHVLDALRSPDVRAGLEELLDLRSCVREAFASERKAMLASLNLGEELAAAVANPRTQKQLAAHLDLSAVLEHTELRSRLRESLASTDLVEYAERAIPAAYQRLKRRLSQDRQSRSNAALAAGSWVVCAAATALYTALAAELCLVGLGWLSALAFLRTHTFLWAWLTLPVHTARILVAISAARRIPPLEALVRAACEPPSAPVASQPQRAGVAALLDPARRRLGLLVSLWVACSTLDAIAAVARAFAFEFEGEVAAKVVLAQLLACFLVVDAVPLLAWPALAWALGPQHTAAAEAALSAPWDGRSGAYRSGGALGPLACCASLAAAALRSLRGSRRRAAPTAAPPATAAPARPIDDWMGGAPQRV